MLKEEIETLRLRAQYCHNVFFQVGLNTDGTIRFWNFGRAGMSYYRVGTSEKGAGRNVLAQLCEIADKYGVRIILFCTVDKLIDGLYADFDFTQDMPEQKTGMRYMTRQPRSNPACSPCSKTPLSARSPLHLAPSSPELALV